MKKNQIQRKQKTEPPKLQLKHKYLGSRDTSYPLYCKVCIAVCITIPFSLIFASYLQVQFIVDNHPVIYDLRGHKNMKSGTNIQRFHNSSNESTPISVPRNRPGSAILNDRKRYVCSTYGPRLGNLMFLYASNYGFAFDNNLTLALQRGDPIYEPFLISKPFKERRTLCRGHTKIFVQKRPGYYEHFEIPKKGNVRLSGYLQSWKYFRNSFEDLRQQFTFKPVYAKQASTMLMNLKKSQYPNINSDNVTTVGIHIRRGDRIGERNAVADLKYIETAKGHFLKKYTNVLFIVATNADDEAREWCINNVINGSGNSVFSGFNHRFVDMALLSMCDHMIMSTGTYGWWSAFLNRGTVFYYDWIPHNHYKFYSEDYFPPFWIGIKSTTTYPTYKRFDTFDT